VTWLRAQGARCAAHYAGDRQSALVNGKTRFFGRLPIEVSGGGADWVQALDRAVAKAGITVLRYRAVALDYDGERAAACARSATASKSNRGGAPWCWRAAA